MSRLMTPGVARGRGLSRRAAATRVGTLLWNAFDDRLNVICRQGAESSQGW